MRRAVVLGGGGQVGVAICSAFAGAGWQVVAVTRSPQPIPPELLALGVVQHQLDREQGTLKGLAGCDALVDVVAYSEAHGRQLLEIAADVGAIAFVSSSSVYCDLRGRTLDEAAENGFPRFDGPIGEDQPTVPPGDQTYSTRKVLIERLLLDEAPSPVTILRPGAIHGPYTTHPRELWFVKRAMDRRPQVPLAFGGASRFQTTAAETLAGVCVAAVDAGGGHLLNVGDPDTPTVEQIGAAIFAAHGVPWSPVLLEGVPQGTVGRTPWSIPRPLTLDLTRSRALIGDTSLCYTATVLATCRWIAEALGGRDWRAAFPHLDVYGYDWFDYAAEDAWLAAGEPAAVVG